MSPFNCDLCGEECSYGSLVITLRNKQELVFCSKCFKEIEKRKRKKE
jgi:hypothetical protein